MNYVEELAKLFNVSVGEWFKLKGNDNLYKFDNKLVLIKKSGDQAIRELIKLLSGKMEIVKLPFKPEYYHKYFYVGANGLIYCTSFQNQDQDFYRYTHGNCFGTDKEITEEKIASIVEDMMRKYEGDCDI